MLFGAVLALAAALSVGQSADAKSVADGHCPPGLLNAPGLKDNQGLQNAPGHAGGDGPLADPDCVGAPVTTTATTTAAPTTTRSSPATTRPPVTSVPPSTGPPSDPGPDNEPEVVRPTATVAGVTVTREPEVAQVAAAPPVTVAPRIRTEREEPAPAASSDRSLLADSIPTISDLKFDLGDLGINLAFVLLLLLLLGLPAEIINSTWKAHYGAHAARFQRLDRLENAINRLPNMVLLTGFGVVGALIYAQLDPGFGWNRKSLILFAGLTAALVVVTGVFEALRIPYFQRRGGRTSHLQMFPLALVAAAVFVILSRILHFEPGFIFGITCGLALSREINDIEEGRSVAFAAIGLLVLSFASWLIWTPVADAASGADPSTMTLFFDVLLSSLWVSGLQAVIFGLMPMRFLPGEKVIVWSRKAWAGIYGLSLFLLVTALLHPSSETDSGMSDTAFWVLLGVFSALSLAAFAVWAWFRYVVPRRRPEPSAPREIDLTGDETIDLVTSHTVETV